MPDVVLSAKSKVYLFVNYSNLVVCERTVEGKTNEGVFKIKN